jgi:hypothetical protein
MIEDKWEFIWVEKDNIWEIIEWFDIDIEDRLEVLDIGSI